jgi:hypothetical protein
MLTRKWVAPATYVHTAGSSPEHDPQVATTAPDEGLESSTVVRGGLAFAYGLGRHARQAGKVGAAAPLSDVDTKGSSPEHDPQAAKRAGRCCADALSP